MNHQSSSSEAAGASLELKTVGDISGQFVVARYQRGYRWTPDEVKRLLVDIRDNGDKAYSLQPLVVKRLGPDRWELVDGQQRLTTLYLIFLYMQREGLQSLGPMFTLSYETRPGSEEYLRELDPARKKDNIDFFRMREAYDCIAKWFGDFVHRRQFEANEFYGRLFKNVNVIWYEAPQSVDATTLFTRLNVGRIPLTDAELVKALLLQRIGAEGEPNERTTERRRELAASWDRIEQDLQEPNLWAFVAGESDVERPTRITLLLDTLAGPFHTGDRPQFHTFDQLQGRVGTSPGKAEELWEGVLDLHAKVKGWFDDTNLFHKVGYLVALDVPFSDLVTLEQKASTKKGFESALDARIRKELSVTTSRVQELSYDKPGDHSLAHALLLLMNVETVRLRNRSTERYPFYEHAHGEWSLEHIHAQNAESLTTEAQWNEWLRLHLAALVGFPSGNPSREREDLIESLKAGIGHVNRQSFRALAKAVSEFFSLEASVSLSRGHSLHSISNLALLSRRDNSELNNAVFEVKRRRILELDRSGDFIPVCTRQVFLKYYTEAGDQQIHFWGPQDRAAYLDAMIRPETGLLWPYLTPEER